MKLSFVSSRCLCFVISFVHYLTFESNDCYFDFIVVNKLSDLIIVKAIAFMMQMVYMNTKEKLANLMEQIFLLVNFVCQMTFI